METQRVQCPSEMVTKMRLEPKIPALKQVLFFSHFIQILKVRKLSVAGSIGETGPV